MGWAAATFSGCPTRTLSSGTHPVDVASTAVDEAASRNMTLTKRADAGNLHVRGFRGRGPRDHFDHLYLIGEVLRFWVVPRWKREPRLVYTMASEQL